MEIPSVDKNNNYVYQLFGTTIKIIKKNKSTRHTLFFLYSTIEKILLLEGIHESTVKGYPLHKMRGIWSTGRTAD